MITWLEGHWNALINVLNNLLILLIKKCFENCTEAAFYYHYVKEKENSYECICQNLWFYERNNYIQCIEPNVKECVVYDYEDKFFGKKYFDKKYLVNDTNECVNKCPSGSYSFNYVC